MKKIKEILSFFKRKEKTTITQLPIFPEADILEIKEFASNGWELGETHGLSH